MSNIDFRMTAQLTFVEKSTGVRVQVLVPYPVSPDDTPVFKVLRALCEARALDVEPGVSWFDEDGNALTDDEADAAAAAAKASTDLEVN